MSAVVMDPRIAARREAVRNEESRHRSRRVWTIVAFVVLWAALAASTQTPLLDVDEVRVTGTEALSPETVAAVAGVDLGTPLLGLDLTPAREAIAELPWVAQVSSQQSVSGDVVFHVTEREPVAQFTTPGGAVMVDREGRVLAVLATPDPTMIAIGGTTFAAEPGAWVDDRLLGAIETATTLPPDVAKVTAEVRVTSLGMELALHRPGSILLGDGRELDAKFRSVRAFLAGVELECLDVLDVRTPAVRY